MSNRPPRHDRILIYFLVTATAALVATTIIVTGTTTGLADLASFILSVSAITATVATTANSRRGGKDRPAPSSTARRDKLNSDEE